MINLTSLPAIAKNSNQQIGSSAENVRSLSSAHSVLEGINMAPKHVDDALSALETIAARLRERGDARAVFPDVYAVITRRVKMAIEGDGPAFHEPQWISKLTGLFCQEYLKALAAALDGTHQEGEAWGVAFHRGDASGVAASLDALLGINAHINFDLAQGLYDNIIAHNAAHDRGLLARYRHDHDLVNSILGSAMPEIFSILSEQYQCPIASIATCSKGVEEAVSLAVLFALRQWRDQVWDDLTEMLAASSRCGLDAVLLKMNKSSRRIARVIRAGNVALAACSPRRWSAAYALPLPLAS